MSTHIAAENRKGDIDMVYSANPISKEQLQKALEEYLNDNGLPTSEDGLNDAICNYLEDEGLPTYSDELDDAISDYIENNVEMPTEEELLALMKTVINVRPKTGTSSYIIPCLPLDKVFIFNDNEEFSWRFQDQYSFDDPNGITVNICIFYADGTTAETPVTDSANGLLNVWVAMRTKNIFSPNDLPNADQPGPAAVYWTLTFSKPIRCNDTANYPITLSPYTDSLNQ